VQSTACSVPSLLLFWLLPVQPDVVQPFEGDGLDWSEFAVQLGKEDIPNLEQILRAIPSEAVAKKRDAMERVKRRFIWSSTNYDPFRELSQEVSVPRTIKTPTRAHAVPQPQPLPAPPPGGELPMLCPNLSPSSLHGQEVSVPHTMPPTTDTNRSRGSWLHCTVPYDEDLPFSSCPLDCISSRRT